MDNSKASDLTLTKKPVKKAWQFGTATGVIIDSSLIKNLGVEVQDLYFEQERVSEGILLRIVKAE